MRPSAGPARPGPPDGRGAGRMHAAMCSGTGMFNSEFGMK